MSTRLPTQGGLFSIHHPNYSRPSSALCSHHPKLHHVEERYQNIGSNLYQPKRDADYNVEVLLSRAIWWLNGFSNSFAAWRRGLPRISPHRGHRLLWHRWPSPKGRMSPLPIRHHPPRMIPFQPLPDHGIVAMGTVYSKTVSRSSSEATIGLTIGGVVTACALCARRRDSRKVDEAEVK